MLRTDVHCHILPGVDDGSRSRVDSLHIASGLARMGVERVHATPHQFRFGNDFALAEIHAMVDELRGWLRDARIELEVLPAAEYMFSERLLDAIAGGEELATWPEPGGDGTCILVELPIRQPVVGVRRLAAALRKRDIVPVMAHPERIVGAQMDRRRITEWRDAGWVFQLDLLSLVGAYGREARSLGRDLVRAGYVEVTGGDIHRPVQLGPLAKARQLFAEMSGMGATS